MNNTIPFLNRAGTTEIYIYGDIGQSIFSPEGITSKDFREQLSKVPATNTVLIRINSPGGSIGDALAMHDALRERGGRIEVHVDCICASAATYFLDKAFYVTASKNAEIMIHKPWRNPGGSNADELRQAADQLDIWEEKMIGIYQSRTGLGVDAIKDLLRNETWMTAQEALEMGFIDSIANYSEEEEMKAVAAKAEFDFKHFEKYQDFLNKQSVSQLHKEKKNMNVTAQLEILAKAGKISDNEVSFWANKAQEDEKIANLINKIAEQPAEDKSADVYLDVVRNLISTNEALAQERRKAKDAADKARKASITADVEQAIKDGKIKNTDAENWVNLIFADDNNKKLLDNLPAYQKPEPVAGNKEEHEPIYETSPDVMNLAKGIHDAPRSVNRARIIGEHYDKLVGYATQNSATISAELKQNIIMKTALDQFAIITGPLTRYFTTMFKDVPLSDSGTDTIVLPYYPLWDITPKDFDYSTGYNDDEEFNVQYRSIKCDKRQYVGFKWTSYDINRTPFFNINKFFAGMGTALGVKVWKLIHNQITAANFPNKAFSSDVVLNTFNSDKIADVKLKCDTMQWMPGRRQMVINSVFENQLLKDTAIKNYAASNFEGTLRDGRFPSIFGFKIDSNPNIPNNSEKLFGYVAMPEALGIVNAPIRMDAMIPGQYEQMTDPNTGMTIEARWGGDFDSDTAKVYLEFNCGFGVLENKALLRMVSSV